MRAFPLRNTLLVPALAASLLSAGCATAEHGAGAHASDTASAPPQLAIRRGASWATFSFAPPHINGATAELELNKNGALRGFIGGGTLDVDIRDGQADGFGPSGPVAMDVDVAAGKTVISGMWNGGPVHFTYEDGALHGSVVWRHGRTMASEQSCAYDLKPSGQAGTLAGSSSCGTGLFVGTRLEVDPRLSAMMSPTQLAVVLVAALASPT
jgi:hypothetical protein